MGRDMEEEIRLADRAGSFRSAEVYSSRDQKLHTVPVTGSGRPGLSDTAERRWQQSLSFLVRISGAEEGLILRVEGSGMKAALHSGRKTEPWLPDSFFPFGSRTALEDVLARNCFCMDASSDPAWAGLPIRWEDGSFYGVLCLIGSGMTEQAVHAAAAETVSSLEKDLELLSLHQGHDEQQEKYARAMEALLQYSPGGIFSYSAEEDEKFSYVSENMLAFLGYTLKEFIARFDNRFSHMVYEEDRARTLREIDAQIAHGPFDRVKYRIEKKDGSLVWVHDEGHIVNDASGKRWFYVVIVDITDSVLAQQAEQEKFRTSMQALLSANPEAVGTIQLNLTSNACGEAHGLTAMTRKLNQEGTVDGFLNAVASQIANADQQRRFLETFSRQALLKGFSDGTVSQSMDYQRRECDGSLVWIRMSMKLLQNPDNADIVGVAFSADITKQRRTDQILRIITSKEYDMIALVHPKLQLVEAYFLGSTLPPQIRALLPRPGAVCGLKEFREEAAERWIIPEDRERYRRCSEPVYYLAQMDQGENYEFVARQQFTPGGPVMYRKYQHYYLEGERDTILVIESDVSSLYAAQQQELEEAHAETEHILDIMDSITAGICVLHMPDADHVSISYVNQQLFRLLQFPEDSIERRNRQEDDLIRRYTLDAFSGVHPDDLARVRRVFHEHYQSDRFTISSFRMLGADSRYYWITEEVRLREVTPAYRVFYAVFHDVGEEVRLNAELKAQLAAEKQLRQEAISANAAKTEFLSRMSHDIRTPLNGIIGMTYLAKEQSNPPRTADCLAKIDTSSRFLMGLINDVLDMSRAESNRIELHEEPYPIAEFNEYLDAVIRPLCRERGQSFVLDENGVTDAVPIADKLRMNQIIFNLLSNAVKFTPEGGTITYRIRGRMTGPDRCEIQHEISDTGIGMSESFQKILFEPFTQEARDDTSETRGTGLGLAIVKRLVSLMHGSISVTSSPGKGTTFLLTLRFDTVPAGDAGAERQAERASADGLQALAGRHVLLCEDHPLNQEIASALLAEKGIITEVAVNGRQGAEKFASSPLRYYDAILMDIRMPVMDGYEATRKIRAMSRSDAKDIPIIAMTADAFQESLQEARASGMNDSITKPIDVSRMFRVLSEYMHR